MAGGFGFHDDDVEEVQQSLISPTDKKKVVTPLPKLQLGVLLFFQLAEPITSQCIYPFINQLISELDITGGDEAKVGYYAGLIESLFFATEAMFILQWSRISDQIGRKPVLLVGVAGLCFSMIFFGLSKTFMSLVLSRCLVGMLNGNLGVIKSMMAELTDATNRAQGYALMPVVWSTGNTVGPLMGGILSKPHDHWPEQFSDRFWVEYPYFLPCAAAAAFSGFTFIVTALFLKETVPKRPSPLKSGFEDRESYVPPAPPPLPMRELLTYPVLLSVSCYATLAMLDIAYRAILPLFYATPIHLGGLGQSPAQIGTTLACFGISNGLFQAFFFARLIEAVGPRKLFLAGLGMYVMLFWMFPVIRGVAQVTGVTGWVWVLVAVQLSLTVACDLAYGSIFLYVSAASPNRQSLGATNGVAQLAASIVRAVGPALSTSLFAASVQHDWLGGTAVYVILICLAWASLLVGRRLPTQLWNEEE
ncbi:MFS general substrate transporter [Irpex rosettiformis]|uniref:MFS general substrate transporter n=1 Tax=Irpex rosettiformis TaxID=378272 RepID=A0ACB8U7G1_9APHY|nr:MFS general substrate transporter [Irpex rosettiformis]